MKVFLLTVTLAATAFAQTTYTPTACNQNTTA